MFSPQEMKKIYFEIGKRLIIVGIIAALFGFLLEWCSRRKSFDSLGLSMTHHFWHF